MKGFAWLQIRHYLLYYGIVAFLGFCEASSDFEAWG